MFRIISLLAFIILFQNCFAQKKYTTARTATGKVRIIYERGMRMSFNGQPDDALKDFEQALQLDPSFIDAQIQWADVKNQKGRLAEAESGYEKALAIDSTYEPGVFYSLGIVEFEQKKFEEATAHFQQYLQSGKTSEKRRSAAEKYLRNTRFAAEAMKHPVPYQPVNLGPNINTADAEYLPTLTADGETLIYTAVRRGQEDFYKSKKVNGEWQKGQPIEAVNTPDNEGAQSISADGKFMVFTACLRRDGLGGCDLYFSELKNGAMTQVRNIGAPVNSASWESQPSISADGKTLYFASDRKGGRGGKDLWVSQRQANGKWSEPQNLGPAINTQENEQAPFIHPDGQTLYFMSNGYPGMGGFDLYLSRLQPDGKWGEPQNLGYPINTEGNEGALFISLDGKTAYFATDVLNVEKGVSSFDNPQGKGTTDIYSFELYEGARPQPVTYVKATVSDGETGQKLAAKVEFVELETGKVLTSSVTDKDGEFLVTLPAGKDYSLNVSKEKYLFYSDNFSLTHGSTIEKPFLLAIFLVPIPSGTGSTNDVLKPTSNPIVLKNIFFETGSAALKKESLTELNYLKTLMSENPSLKIQINGHTDSIGVYADNLFLSENRAKTVRNFLVENGIAINRLRYKGFGETLPIAPNDTEEGRQLNRRTEFVILN